MLDFLTKGEGVVKLHSVLNWIENKILQKEQKY